MDGLYGLRMPTIVAGRFARSTTCVAAVKSYTYRRLTQRLGQEGCCAPMRRRSDPRLPATSQTLRHLTAR